MLTSEGRIHNRRQAERLTFSVSWQGKVVQMATDQELIVELRKMLLHQAAQPHNADRSDYLKEVAESELMSDMLVLVADIGGTTNIETVKELGIRIVQNNKKPSILRKPVNSLFVGLSDFDGSPFFTNGVWCWLPQAGNGGGRAGGSTSKRSSRSKSGAAASSDADEGSDSGGGERASKSRSSGEAAAGDEEDEDNGDDGDQQGSADGDGEASSSNPKRASMGKEAKAAAGADGGKKTSYARFPWTPTEDALLRDACTKIINDAREEVLAARGSDHAFDPRSVSLPWINIAGCVPGKSRKQCRDRWVHHLQPGVNNAAPFTMEEDGQILAQMKIHGNRWSEICKGIRGRTDLSVKNRYYTSLKGLGLDEHTPKPVIDKALLALHTATPAGTTGGSSSSIGGGSGAGKSGASGGGGGGGGMNAADVLSSFGIYKSSTGATGGQGGDDETAGQFEEAMSMAAAAAAADASAAAAAAAAAATATASAAGDTSAPAAAAPAPTAAASGSAPAPAPKKRNRKSSGQAATKTKASTAKGSSSASSASASAASAAASANEYQLHAHGSGHSNSDDGGAGGGGIASYCLCAEPETSTVGDDPDCNGYIQCNTCNEWFHPACIGYTWDYIAPKAEAGDFMCGPCTGHDHGAPLPESYLYAKHSMIGIASGVGGAGTGSEGMMMGMGLAMVGAESPDTSLVMGGGRKRARVDSVTDDGAAAGFLAAVASQEVGGSPAGIGIGSAASPTPGDYMGLGLLGVHAHGEPVSPSQGHDALLMLGGFGQPEQEQEQQPVVVMKVPVFDTTTVSTLSGQSAAEMDSTATVSTATNSYSSAEGDGAAAAGFTTAPDGVSAGAGAVTVV